jgi:hypothetical protein
MNEMRFSKAALNNKAAAGICVLSVTIAAAAQAQLKQPSGFPLPFGKIAIVSDSSLLARPVAGEIGTDGSVAIVDLQDARVHLFSPEGRLVISVGARGEGPGEFKLPTRVILPSSGEIVVYDQSNHQFSRFTRAGTFIDRKVFDIDFRSIDNIVALPDGGIAVAGISFNPKSALAPLHVFDAQFHHVRSFGQLPAHTTPTLLPQVGVGTVSVVNDRELLFTRRAPFDIVRHDLTGAVIRSYSPGLSSARSLDDAVATSSTGSSTTATLSTATLPTRAFLLPNGFILTGRFNRTRRTWDVLDSAGRPIWSGDAPGGLMTQVVGVDGTRNVIWLLGQANEAPVLYRVEIAR